MIRARLLAITTLLAAAAAACTSPVLSPGILHGTYVLLSVDGEPVPAVYNVLGADTVYLVHEILRLKADRTGTRRSETRFERPGRTPEHHTTESELTFRIRGAHLEITTLCPPNALCTEPPHDLAVREGDRLIVETGMGDRTLEYRRTNPFFR